MTAIDDPAEILTVGRLADELYTAGMSWPAILTELNESSTSYVQGAHRTYLAEIEARAHRDQISLF